MADETALHYLKKHFRKYGAFKVMLSSQDRKYHKHFLYPSPEYDSFFTIGEQATDREIFPDEVVIDTDLPAKVMNELALSTLMHRLGELRLNYSAWDTGGKGYHIHLFFQDIAKKYSQTSIQSRRAKEYIIRYITACDRECSSCTYCSGILLNGMHCFVRSKNIDMQLCGKHMIRLEGGWHPDTGNNKTLIVEYRDHKGTNAIPEWVHNRMARVPVEVETPSLVIPKERTQSRCLDYFLNNTFTDCRQRIAFLIPGLMRRHGWKKEDALKELIKWTARNDCRVSAERIISRTYSSDLLPGCAYCRTLLNELGRPDIACNNGGIHHERTGYKEERPSDGNA